MCGLAGVVDATTTDARRGAVVGAMTRAVAHRGPVGSRVAVHAAVALGHAALPLCHGAVPQPWTTPSGRVTVVLNGEVYGLAAQRARLAALGGDPSLRSDTEVVAALVELAGVRAFDGLEGMFAVAAVDHVRRELLLARDRRGKKPLYVARLGAAGGWPRVVFASELTAVLAHPDVPAEPDVEVLGHYLRVRSVPAPASALAHVAKLQPGTVLRLDADGAEVHDVAPPAPGPAPDVAGTADALGDALTAAVDERVRSTPARVGVLLSGGVDSAVVAALTARAAAEPVSAYTVRFGSTDVDEGDAAAAVCARLGLRHRERHADLALLGAEAHRVLDELDEPLADPSLVPLRLAAETAAADGVRVVLTGDGADELFYGYRWFEAEAFLWRVRRAPDPLVRAAFTALSTRAAAAAGLPLTRYAADLARAVGSPPGAGFVAAHSGVDARTAARLPVPPQPLAGPTGAGGAGTGTASLDERLALSRAQVLRLFLGDTVLTKLDRGTTAHGVEARSPFLADAVWRLGTGAAPSACMVGGRGKVPVRALAARLLGGEVAGRQKVGFRAPLAAMLRGPLRERLLDTLTPARVAAAGAWDPVLVRGLVQAHVSGRADHAQVLWTLLVHAAWAERVAAARATRPRPAPESVGVVR